MGSNCCKGGGAVFESDDSDQEEASVVTLSSYLGDQESSDPNEIADNVEPSEQSTDHNEKTMEEAIDNVEPSEDLSETSGNVEPSSQVTDLSETSDNVEPSSQVTDPNETTMEETIDNVAPTEQNSSSLTLRNSQVVEKFESQEVTSNANVVPTEQDSSSLTLRNSEIVEKIESQEETSSTKESQNNLDQDGYNASNILWTKKCFSDKIPNGFYSLIPDDSWKLLKHIPTLEELHELRKKDVKTDVILIDFAKDQMLVRLKQLLKALVGGSNLNQVALIKKIVTMVSDVYNNPIKTTQLEFPMLGQIKDGSCRARAMLFKVLADAAGVKSTIVMGFPESKNVDSCKHMSIVVEHNTVDCLVDLVRSPGQLIRFSEEAIREAHTSPPGNASCDSPFGLNSPIYRRSVRTARTRESLNQRSLLKEQADANVSGSPLVSHSQVSKLDQRKAMSLPSSRQNYESQRKREQNWLQNIKQIWNRVVESQKFQNKPLLPYEEWNIDYSELKVGTRIGVGSFGIVYRGKWNGIKVAVKYLLKRNLEAADMEDFYNEVSIHSRLRHPNVVLFLGACTKPPHLSIVTELIKRGSLYDILHSPKHKKDLSTWRLKIKLMRNICKGLMHIHRMGIVHRDLKSANCLVTKNWKVKICDFGLSIVTHGKTMKATVSPGTPQWMAPELIRKETFSEKCDIFSFGVIMWEICTLSQPWNGIPIETVAHIVAKEGGRLEIPQGPVGKLIADCWLEPEQRPSCSEILSHLAFCKTYLCSV